MKKIFLLILPLLLTLSSCEYKEPLIEKEYESSIWVSVEGVQQFPIILKFTLLECVCGCEEEIVKEIPVTGPIGETIGQYTKLFAGCGSTPKIDVYYGKTHKEIMGFGKEESLLIDILLRADGTFSLEYDNVSTEKIEIIIG